MPRWSPQVQERLEEAALQLFTERGYAATTVADVAARVGVTARTYFRYFPDKREVLFAGSADLTRQITAALQAAPPDLAPLEAVLHAMATCEDLYRAQGAARLRQRDDVVAGSGELQEREADKLASIARAVSGELTARGTPPPDAALVADIAVAVFRSAAREWVNGPSAPYAAVLQRTAERARQVVGGARPDTP